MVAYEPTLKHVIVEDFACGDFFIFLTIGPVMDRFLTRQNAATCSDVVQND